MPTNPTSLLHDQGCLSAESNNTESYINDPKYLNIHFKGCGLDDRRIGVRFQMEQKFSPYRCSGARGEGSTLLELNGPESESDKSPTSSGDVKIAWSYTSTTPCVVILRCSIKQGKHFVYHSYAQKMKYTKYFC